MTNSNDSLIDRIRALRPNTIGMGEGYDDALDDVVKLIRQHQAAPSQEVVCLSIEDLTAAEFHVAKAAIAAMNMGDASVGNDGGTTSADLGREAPRSSPTSPIPTAEGKPERHEPEPSDSGDTNPDQQGDAPIAAPSAASDEPLGDQLKRVYELADRSCEILDNKGFEEWAKKQQGLNIPDAYAAWNAALATRKPVSGTTGSSNGRKSDFDSDNLGSSPSPVTKEQPDEL